MELFKQQIPEAVAEVFVLAQEHAAQSSAKDLWNSRVLWHAVDVMNLEALQATDLHREWLNLLGTMEMRIAEALWAR